MKLYLKIQKNGAVIMKSKMRKTMVSLLTAAIVSMSLSSTMSASAASNDKTFRIYYNVNANSGVAEMSSHLFYDYTKVEVKKVVKGTLGGSHGFSANTYGVLDATYKNTSNIYAAGILLYVSFDADSDVDKLSDYASFSITSVKNAAGTSLSTSKVYTNTILVGDVNQDGEVDSLDLLMLKKYLAGTQTLTGNALRSADTDGDFDVDNDDMELLKGYILQINDFEM